MIAVGGDKLSRGLTLEGLCVSYYLAGVEDVRHAHADGSLVRVPAGLHRPVPAVHHRASSDW